MKSILVVVSSDRDVRHLPKILAVHELDQVIVVSVNPRTGIALTAQSIPFHDIGEFFPPPTVTRRWQQSLQTLLISWWANRHLEKDLVVIGVNIGKAAMFGLHLHLSEIGHSLLTAQQILNRIRPDLVYCSENTGSLPFRRYDDETLNFETIAISREACRRHIPVTNLSRCPRLEWAWILPYLTHLGSLVWSLRQETPVAADISPQIVVLGNYHQLANLVPAIKEFKRQGINFLLTGKTIPQHRNKLKRDAVPFVEFSSLLSQRKTALTNLWFSIKFALLFLKHHPRLRKLFSAIHPMLWQLLQYKFLWYYLVEFPEIATTAMISQRLFSTKRHAFITMTTSDHFSKTIALTAKSRAVPVIELQHGWYLRDFEYFMRENDYFLIWGQSTRAALRGPEQLPVRSPVAGYPWFDQYRKIDRQLLRKTGIKKLRLTPSEKVILILASMPKDLEDERMTLSVSPYQYATVLFNAIREIAQNWRIIFRPHPGCAVAWVIDLAKQLGINLTYDDRSLPLQQVIAVSDIVIANFTTALVDTMFIGRPILLFSFYRGADHAMDKCSATQLGAWKRFQTKQELQKLFYRYTSDKKAITAMLAAQRTVLSELAPQRKTPAAEEIARFVKRISNSV